MCSVRFVVVVVNEEVERALVVGGRVVEVCVVVPVVVVVLVAGRGKISRLRETESPLVWVTPSHRQAFFLVREKKCPLERRHCSRILSPPRCLSLVRHILR
ncbi:hypothetical protein E2C01_024217 [Portunus trituberculatus]|uniref:Uncharacterized protein n=1 Tax=Portunus trituberculatus TaxID=210409 RepID=A0A5B7EC50_PORTR|nr:hypothetical protein [Portunus trituberculatus]